MRVKSLQLRHFRNYNDTRIEFCPGRNIFLGNNGQGKTNLLESLYLLSHARSHRTGSDRELIQKGQEHAAIAAHLTNHYYDGQQQLEAQVRVLDGRLKTSFRINAQTAKSRSEVLGYLPTVSFFLPDLLLVRGAPEDRRRWLDSAIVQYDKRHLLVLSEFQKVRQQKNKLLKDEMQNISKEHLRVWNTQLAMTGARVMASRLSYLARIESLAALAYLELSEGQETLEIHYQSELWDELSMAGPIGQMVGEGAMPTAETLELALLDRLESRMHEELRRGTCLVGPHRDDILFSINGMDAAAYGSQGQQRSIVLALKRAELSSLSAKLQEPPVLLLDDVMAELDPNRQRMLVEHINPESQVFITTTHPAETWQGLLAPMDSDSEGVSSEVAVFHVRAGTVQSDRASLQARITDAFYTPAGDAIESSPDAESVPTNE